MRAYFKADVDSQTIPITLTDLDELVLTVRDSNSRTYIAEAVHAYRAGLPRAAVILTWTALAYDLISKYRELADQGEPAAVKFATDLDNAIAAKNVVYLQQTENKLLDLARDPFELIDDRDHAALERLREDRHHCAHPAFTGDSLLFSPLPEQVRAHIVQVVKSVLQHAPLQGKTAFDRLKTDLLQPSFPLQQDQVTTFLQSRYFGRLKPSLITKLISILTKEIVLQPDVDLAKVSGNVVRALIAASVTHAKEYEQIMKSDLGRFAAAADDEKLWGVLLVAGNDSKVWGLLDNATQIRLENLVRGKVIGSRVNMLAYAFKVPELKAIVEAKFQSLDDTKKETFIQACPLPITVDDAVRIFADSGSYRGAEGRCRGLILTTAALMTPKHIEAVLAAVLDNGQIWDAAEIPDLLVEFFMLTKAHFAETAPGWRSFLEQIEKKKDSECWERIKSLLPT